MTVHSLAEGAVFADRPTVRLVEAAVDVLRDGHVVLGDGEQDLAAAELLEVLADLHRTTGLNLEGLWQARAFAISILDGRREPR